MFQTTTHFKIFIFQTSLQWSSWYGKQSKRKAKGYLALCLQLTANMFGWSKSQMWKSDDLFCFSICLDKRDKSKAAATAGQSCCANLEEESGLLVTSQRVYFQNCLFKRALSENCRGNEALQSIASNLRRLSKFCVTRPFSRWLCSADGNLRMRKSLPQAVDKRFCFANRVCLGGKRNLAQLCNLFLNPLAPTENRTRHKQKGPNWQTEVISESMGTNTHKKRERVSW